MLEIDPTFDGLKNIKAAISDWSMQLSPITSITLTGAQKKLANIPEGAAKFAFACAPPPPPGARAPASAERVP